MDKLLEDLSQDGQLHLLPVSKTVHVWPLDSRINLLRKKWEVWKATALGARIQRKAG